MTPKSAAIVGSRSLLWAHPPRRLRHHASTLLSTSIVTRLLRLHPHSTISSLLRRHARVTSLLALHSPHTSLLAAHTRSRYVLPCALRRNQRLEKTLILRDRCHGSAWGVCIVATQERVVAGTSSWALVKAGRGGLHSRKLVKQG